MLLTTDYYTPAELSGYARQALAELPDNAQQLARWLPNRTVDDLEYRFNRGGGGLTEAASYRAFDAESPIGRREGGARTTGELLPLSEKIPLGEYDQLRRRANPTPAIQTGLLSDVERQVRKLAARVELARGELLATGKLVLNENKLKSTVDFGRDPGNAVNVGTAWSNLASATVLTDLDTAVQDYSDKNGQAPGAILTSRKYRGYMRRNAEIRGLLATGNQTPSVVSVSALDDFLDSEDLPPVITYDAKYTVEGVTKRVIPENLAILLPPPGDPGNPDGTDLGATMWGTTAYALQPEFALTGNEPGMVAGSYFENDPPSLWTLVAAIVLPGLANPNLSYALTVGA